MNFATFLPHTLSECKVQAQTDQNNTVLTTEADTEVIKKETFCTYKVVSQTRTYCTLYETGDHSVQGQVHTKGE